jgi:CMP-N-acetylneuraminic acid synthetase
VCLYYATAPFVQVEDLKMGLAALMQDGARFAFPVTTFASPIQRALARDSEGGVTIREPQHLTTRSQDLTEYLHDTGQFYWGLADAWLKGEAPYSVYARTFIMPRYRVQDIDTPEDWIRAEIILEMLNRAEWKSRHDKLQD